MQAIRVSSVEWQDIDIIVLVIIDGIRFGDARLKDG